MRVSGYCYQSCFGPYIETFIREKRNSGFNYESEEWRLTYFDAFCVQKSVSEPALTRDLVRKWGTIRDNEAMATCSARISVLHQFALFLTSLGMEAYIPSHFFKAEKTVVHILSDDDIRAAFRMIDNYVLALHIPAFHRLAAEYKVIFRLIYCCGLRISEARRLKWNNVGLKEGAIRILQMIWQNY